MCKNGFRWLAGAFLLGTVVPLPAQETGVATRISASAKDAVFLVDGRSFTGAAMFTWPAGSKHTLEILPVQYAAWLKTRYVFQSWSTPSGALPTAATSVTITAGGIAWYNADLTIQHALSLNFFQCGAPPCPSPGTIWVNSTAYQQDADVWTAAGSTVSLLATPATGYIFAGWGQGGPASSLYSLVVKEPITVYPRFALTRAVQLLTSPEGLEVLADRAPVLSPMTLEWGWNTTHTLGVRSPQWDRVGKLWLFRSWSDGGGMNHSWEVPSGQAPLPVTAQFVRAVPVLIDTVPAGLSVSVDGSDGATPRNAFWAAGDTHTVTAPQRQVDAAGAPWVFRAWSSGSGNAQTIIVTDAQEDSGIRMSATYDPRSRIRVETVPSGLAVAVDGAECRTPCEVERAVGETVRLSAPAAIAVNEGTRLDLLGWDGGAATLTAAAGYHKVTARYVTSYRLTTRSDPEGAAGWRISPGSSDGFYAAGTAVNVAVDAAAGMKFRGWGLDLAGTGNPAALAMDGPRAVLALFERLPESPAPPRVTNAAGQIGIDAVAPGSIASLVGTELVTETAEGATDPLPQTLAGATLQCAGRLLPLLYVSPQQINFQVPGDFSAGDYELQLVRSDSAPVRVKFRVARNAPGLFAAVHGNGMPVSADLPVVPGERITLYGTGFAPLSPPPPDGFRIQPEASTAIADVVEAVVGERILLPDAASAVKGAVGVQALEIRIPEDIAATAPLALSVRAGGVESNRLALPLQ